MANITSQQQRDERDQLGKSAQLKFDNQGQKPGCRDQIDLNETAPLVAASPSRRTSDKLDEEE